MVRMARATSSTVQSGGRPSSKTCGIAENSDGGPEDEQADGEAEQRINPADAGRADDDGAEDDGDGGERIAEIVNEDAAEI